MSFQLPKITTFPPFYTRQPHQETWEKQKKLWCELILQYQSSIKQDSLDATIIPEIFKNKKINRSLDHASIKLIFAQLVSDGNAEYIDKKQEKILLYYKKPDQIAIDLYKFIVDRGMTDTICTIHELVHGDDSVTESFHGINEIILKKSILILQKQGKAEMFQASKDSEVGVKFF